MYRCVSISQTDRLPRKSPSYEEPGFSKHFAMWRVGVCCPKSVWYIQNQIYNSLNHRETPVSAYWHIYVCMHVCMGWGVLYAPVATLQRVVAREHIDQAKLQWWASVGCLHDDVVVASGCLSSPTGCEVPWESVPRVPPALTGPFGRQRFPGPLERSQQRQQHSHTQRDRSTILPTESKKFNSVMNCWSTRRKPSHRYDSICRLLSIYWMVW